jgi:hypothetical protein
MMANRLDQISVSAVAAVVNAGNPNPFTPQELDGLLEVIPLLSKYPYSLCVLSEFILGLFLAEITSSEQNHVGRGCSASSVGARYNSLQLVFFANAVF